MQVCLVPCSLDALRIDLNQVVAPVTWWQITDGQGISREPVQGLAVW
jgi:hypothetical protein